MAKKKRQITHTCGAKVEIYRKGKRHRAFICDNCGLIATNPGALGSIAKRAGKALLGEIPGASLVMEGLGLASDLTKKDDTPKAARPTSDRYTTEERVRDALKARG